MKRSKFFNEVRKFWHHEISDCTYVQKQGRRFRGKGGIVSDYLPWLLIGIAVLAIVMISIFLLKGKGISLIDQIKDLIRLR